MAGYSISNSPEYTISLLMMEDLIIVAKVRVGNKLFCALLYFPSGPIAEVFSLDTKCEYIFMLCVSQISFWASCYNILPSNLPSICFRTELPHYMELYSASYYEESR